MKMNELLSQADAIIFDMDGLLIDSEPYWKLAEKSVFGSLGLTLTDDMLRQVMGFRLSEVVQYWYKYQPWENPHFEQTEKCILDEVEKLIMQHADALPGVLTLLKHLSDSNKRMAVASSSPIRLIQSVVNKLQIKHHFEVLHSAQFEPYGKPHPGIFISTAQLLNVSQEKCVVLEDSINGVIAAKAARMKCIAVPELATTNNPAFAVADLKVSSLRDLYE